VIVAVHVNGNATVGVIARAQGPMSFVSMATTASKSPIPCVYCSSSQETMDERQEFDGPLVHVEL